MRARALKLRVPAGVVVDTCGTGGDGRGTFNISTHRGARRRRRRGVRVAKHGNRALSSRSGSRRRARGARRRRRRAGRGGRALPRRGRHRLPVRAGVPRRHAPRRGGAQELGVRTIFNLLGPLTNPAGARHQLIGVYDSRAGRADGAARSAQLGSRARAGGARRRRLDEFSPNGPTDVAELRDGEVKRYQLAAARLRPRRRGSARARRRRRAGERRGARAPSSAASAGGAARSAVVMSAAAALYAAGTSGARATARGWPSRRSTAAPRRRCSSGCVELLAEARHDPRRASSPRKRAEHARRDPVRLDDLWAAVAALPPARPFAARDPHAGDAARDRRVQAALAVGGRDPPARRSGRHRARATSGPARPRSRCSPTPRSSTARSADLRAVQLGGGCRSCARTSSSTSAISLQARAARRRRRAADRAHPRRGELARAVGAARELGLDALVEAHDDAELDAALAAGAEIIGVNHRDLDTLAIDLSLSARARGAGARARSSWPRAASRRATTWQQHARARRRRHPRRRVADARARSRAPRCAELLA